MMDSIQIIEQSNSRMTVLDLQSKLLQNNIIFLTDPINAESVSNYQAELFYLASKINPKNHNNPIKIYINSPGGEIYSCLGLYDVMQSLIQQGYIIETINVGLAASAAAIILLAGSNGYRSCLPNSTVLLHQPSSGTYGTTTDMEIDLEEVKRLKTTMNNIVSKHASKDLIAMMERDKWLTADDALKYNIIDVIK